MGVLRESLVNRNITSHDTALPLPNAIEWNWHFYAFNAEQKEMILVAILRCFLYSEFLERACCRREEKSSFQSNRRPRREDIKGEDDEGRRRRRRREKKSVVECARLD